MSKAKPKAKFRELDLDAAIEQVEVAVEKELNKPKPRQPRYSDADKSAAANAALKRWLTRAKRAQTYITKYKRQVRYYERKASQ